MSSKSLYDKRFLMNKIRLKLFVIIILSFIALDQKCFDDKKYLELIPGGKIKEYCETFPEERDSRFIARMIWSAVNEKKYSSMTRAEQLAYKSVSEFFIRRETISYDWKKDSFKLVATAAFDLTLKMKLPAEQSHNEVAKMIEMCIKLEEEAEKIEKKAGKIKDIKEKSIKKMVIK